MYINPDMWNEPEKILEKLNTNDSEMSSNEHGFLCGLLRENRPKKILEIGVAAGGTTAVIMNAMQLLNLKYTQVYSVDLNKKYYRDNNKETGYILNEVDRFLVNRENHKFCLGNTVAGKIREIGDGIDFVIIDTMHSLPGELLDFLAVLPYLKKNAIVVLHDVNLQYLDFTKLNGASNCSNNFVATKLLFHTVVAEKYTMPLSSQANIAAFRINDDTYKYIKDIFSLLTIKWSYLPDECAAGEYRNIIANKYQKEYVEIFDLAVSMNRKMVNVAIEVFKNKIEKLKDNEIYLYGAGLKGKQFYKYMESLNINVKGFVVTNKMSFKEELVYGKPVIDVDEYKKIELENKKTVVILASQRDDVKKSIEDNGILYVDVDMAVFEFIDNYK